MHRGRPHPERQLQQGRGTLRAEPRLRLLLPSAFQRSAVSEPRRGGKAAGAADRKKRAAGPADPKKSRREAGLSTGSARVSDDGVLSSLRYLFGDLIGEEDDTPPFLAEGLPEAVAPAASDAVHVLIDYQSTAYAQLYVDRLKRFVGRRGVDDAMHGEIARLRAARMSYEAPIRMAQLKLAEIADAAGNPQLQSTRDVRKFRLDELISALPAIVAEYVLDALEWVGWLHKPVSISFSATGRLGIRRLKLEAWLRRWRRYSVRYTKERVWVERWLHLIDPSLTKQPAAAAAVVQTATMVQGYGDGYRQGVADWNAIIDGLAKPTFDGVLALSDLAGAIEEARATALPDPRQAALKRKIAEIRARVPAGTNAPAGGSAAHSHRDLDPFARF